MLDSAVQGGEVQPVTGYLAHSRYSVNTDCTRGCGSNARMRMSASRDRRSERHAITECLTAL